MFVQLVVAAGNREGQIIPVSGKKFIIGRADDCHLKPRSELISRYHCAILVGNEVVVRDLGSKNGVRLNGEKISAEHKVVNGDKLGIGPLEFFVHIVADVEAWENGQNGVDAGWLHQSGDGAEQAETLAASDSVFLLNHLKSLNQEAMTTILTTILPSEQNAHELLKKFL